MSPLVSFIATVVAFAVAITAHVAIVIGLVRRAPRWRAAIAVIVPPLGVAWSFRERLWFRAAAWIVGATSYVIARSLQ
jgi:hypothetical protein